MRLLFIKEKECIAFIKDSEKVCLFKDPRGGGGVRDGIISLSEILYFKCGRNF